jgi:hypothetical protein
MMNLLRRLANNERANSIATRWRKKRFTIFQSLISSLDPPINILDVGGSEIFWERMNFTPTRDIKIVLLNLDKVETANPDFISVAGDATNMSAFRNKEFDFVFSNSVIEHVGNYYHQRQMAEEIRRVGKLYFIQTPNRFFPIEPHFLFPFFQFLPLRFRVFLVQRFDLGFYAQGGVSDKREAAKVVSSIRLLTEKELKKLFPGGTIYKERVFGLTKSFVVFGQ